MLFNSLEYAGFLLLVIPLVLLLRARVTARNLALLALSYAFYAG